MSKSSSSSLPPLALIAGPTASGKSALAFSLAERTGGMIVNADASQVYADLQILSARPTPGEMAGIEHRLFGHVDGGIAYSAAAWAADARAAIGESHAAGRLPILVGGTGLYIHTLLEGIAPVPEIDPDIRGEVRALATDTAWQALLREDPAAAALLKPADRSRIARALEVIRSSGRSILDWRTERQGGIARGVRLLPLILDPPREQLYARCDARFETMMAAGAEEEVARLIARGLDPALPVMRAIGVPPLIALLEGRITRAEAVAVAQQATRNYAKRQQTWLRNQVDPNWPRKEQVISDNFLRYFEI